MQVNSPSVIDSSSQDNNLSDMDPNAVRAQVKKATLDFKNSWRNLAQALYTVYKDKLYRNWGYEKFDRYTEKEVHIRKHTAMKLIRSYTFLESEEDSLCLTNESESDSVADKPSLTLEAADILRKAKKSLDQGDYEKVKKDIIGGGKESKEVKKDLTALIMKRRKDVNPEEVRTKHRQIAINRFLGLLKAFKNEIEVLKILPGSVAEDIGQLLKTIERHTIEKS
ncbi:MAG: hypothetical protein KAS05_01820 [Candidatus Omnitrophica bacterium]|nr:hypothetical protein [Candidatus Omnitrophota bacterium]